MRLTKEQINTLKDAIYNISSESKIYLFGSRVDDNAKGGDLDILIESNYKFTLRDIFNLKNHFWKKFGEQKLDIVILNPDNNSAFKKLIKQNAIEL